VIAGALFAVFTLHRKGAARTVPAELAFRTCVSFHRRELERQRDLLRSVWTWYLLPFVPGMTVFLFGLFESAMQWPHSSEHARTIVIVFALTAAACALVFVGIGKLNQWAARKLQREIDTLDQLEREP
jgi:dolichol kinase